MADKETITIKVVHYYLAKVLNEESSKVIDIKPEIGQGKEQGYNTVEFTIERDKDGSERFNLCND
ncbi:hypothetical protein ES704_01382 [subsurface metagenome]|jgi:hypothetical protein